MSVRKLDNGKWEARARVDGRHLKKVFERKTDAVAWEAKTRHDRDHGSHVNTSNRTTVAEYFTTWYQGRSLRPNTVRIREIMLRAHLDQTPLGSRPLVKVKPSDVQAYARSRAEVLGPDALRIHIGVLRSAFGAALLDGLITRNPVPPVRGLWLPKPDRPKIIPLTVAQVRAWADAAKPQVRPMILTQAGLGLRISELLGLRVMDVDFPRREVRINGQLNLQGERAPLKTANSLRVVPMPDFLIPVLAGHIRRYPPGNAGYVFTSDESTRTDHAWGQRSAARWYRIAASAAGLPDSTTSHDLRHHYASVLLDAGESVHAVAERLGNTAQMVLGVYGHLMPDREETTRLAIDRAWGAAEITANPPAQAEQDQL